MPETYNDMVECEECGEWFHLKCMGLTKALVEDENCGFVTNMFYTHTVDNVVVLYLYVLFHKHIFIHAYIQLVN